MGKGAQRRNGSSQRRSTVFPVGVCTKCQKKWYPSRKIARKAARRNHPNDLLSAYPCPHNKTLWHYGHSNPPEDKPVVEAPTQTGLQQIHAVARAARKDTTHE